MCIEPLPVARDLPGHAPQNVRCQMRNCHPRQNQKTAIVGQQMNIAPPCFHSPADEPVAASQMPRGIGPTGRRVFGVEKTIGTAASPFSVAYSASYIAQ